MTVAEKKKKPKVSSKPLRELSLKIMTTFKRKRPENVSESRPAKTNQKIFLSLAHPLAIKPLGNYYFDSTSPGFKGSCRSPGLGSIARLTDELILDIIEHFLGPRDLCCLAQASRALYAFSYHDEIWRVWTVNDFGGNFTWSGSWRATYLQTKDPDYAVNRNGSPVQASDFYSDVLFQPFHCASASMKPFIGVENVDRRSNLSVDEFVTNYAIPNKV